MAAEDWDDCDQYQMGEKHSHYSIKCKYCGTTNLRWHREDFGWRLYDGRVRHYCRVAAAIEFQTVKAAKGSIDEKIYWMSPSGLQWRDNIGAPTVKEKPKKKDYNTIGVRYAQGAGQVYTFKIRKGAKVHLGQELVDSRDGNYSVCFVVALHKTPQDTEAHISYRFLNHKVAPL
jgi:hypothetical protein